MEVHELQQSTKNNEKTNTTEKSDDNECSLREHLVVKSDYYYIM